MFVCGAFTKGQKKLCKHCCSFMLWGVSTGYCFKHKTDKMIWEHCKYYKRNAEMYAINGRCKHPELEYM